MYHVTVFMIFFSSSFSLDLSEVKSLYCYTKKMFSKHLWKTKKSSVRRYVRNAHSKLITFKQKMRIRRENILLRQFIIKWNKSKRRTLQGAHVLAICLCVFFCCKERKLFFLLCIGHVGDSIVWIYSKLSEVRSLIVCYTSFIFKIFKLTFLKNQNV